MNSEEELSPLDQVRQEEAEVARRIAGARERAEQTIVRSREQARSLLEEASEAGRREGRTQYRRFMLRAQDQARAICLESQERVEEVRRAERQWLDLAVSRVVEIITAAGGEEP